MMHWHLELILGSMHTVSMSHISHPLSASTQCYPMSLYAPGKIQQLLHRAKEIGAALPQSDYNLYKPQLGW